MKKANSTSPAFQTLSRQHNGSLPTVEFRQKQSFSKADLYARQRLKKKRKQRKPAGQLPVFKSTIVSLWVKAIKFKGGKKEKMHLGGECVQYANHRVEEPRCAATEGTCCIYSPLILHWPPHIVRMTVVRASSQRWPWSKSLHLSISDRVFVSTVQYNREKKKQKNK